MTAYTTDRENQLLRDELHNAPLPSELAGLRQEVALLKAQLQRAKVEAATAAAYVSRLASDLEELRQARHDGCGPVRRQWQETAAALEEMTEERDRLVAALKRRDGS